MFDLNAIVNAAITEAVNARITEVLAQHANIVGGLAERITALEDKLSMLTNHGVKTFENVDALTARVVALENNPAQGVDTTLEQRVAALERDISHKVQVQQANIVAALAERVAALESETQGENRYLNRDDVASLIEEALDNHCNVYDHDSYDAVVSDSDDYVKCDDLEDAVREAVGNLSFDISVS